MYYRGYGEYGSFVVRQLIAWTTAVGFVGVVTIADVVTAVVAAVLARSTILATPVFLCALDCLTRIRHVAMVRGQLPSTGDILAS